MRSRPALIFWVHLAQTSVFVSKSFIRITMEVFLPPNLTRHLKKVAVLVPSSRHISGTGRPNSASFKTAMLWLSVKLNLFAHHFLLENATSRAFGLSGRLPKKIWIKHGLTSLRGCSSEINPHAEGQLTTTRTPPKSGLCPTVTCKR